MTTLADIVRSMEHKYGQAQRVWVFDRGLSSEANLTWLRARGATYLVGTPKSRLRRHEAALLDEAGWQRVHEGLEVKLVEEPGTSERFVLCRSTERAAKEAAILERQLDRLRRKLAQIDAGLHKRPAATSGPVERRVGRWLGRYPAAAAVLSVDVERDEQGRISALAVHERGERLPWKRLAHGAYLLRTNHTEGDPVALWRWYIQLTQAEAAFRSAKSDLHLRPVFHQKTERVEAVARGEATS